MTEREEVETLTVKMPTSVDEAELMQKLGYAYLKVYAPEQLRADDAPFLHPQMLNIEPKPPQDLLDIRDINDRLLEELSNRFKLRTGELNSLPYDDTQRGVEFAFEYLTPYLKAKPAILKD